LTASAPGYLSTSTTLTLAPSGFVISGPNGVGATFGTSLGNGSIDLSVGVVVLDAATLAPTAIFEALRGGIVASVAVTSSGAAVIAPDSSPVIIGAGNISGSVTLQLQTTGQATVTVATPPGFTTPSFGNQLTVIIN
jgi:hypothetical protein